MIHIHFFSVVLPMCCVVSFLEELCFDCLLQTKSVLREYVYCESSFQNALVFFCHVHFLLFFFSHLDSKMKR